MASLTLPAAREFAQFGIRVLAIAPGIMLTPMMLTLPEELQQSLRASVPALNAWETLLSSRRWCGTSWRINI